MPVAPLPTDLCSLDRVKRLLKLDDPAAATDDDDALREMISDVSERITIDTGREFVARNAAFTNPGAPAFGEVTVAPEERTILADGRSPLILGDLTELDSATVNGEPVDLLGWQLLPYVDSPPYRSIALTTGAAYVAGALVKVTAKWGFPRVPESIQAACAKQVAIESERHLETFSATFNLNESRTEVPRGFASAILDVLDDWRLLGPVYAAGPAGEPLAGYARV